MKKLLLVTTPLLMAACTHHSMPALSPMPTQTSAQSSLASLPKETARQGQYMALPGQAAVDTDAAFEQHAAAFTNSAPAPVQTPVVTQSGIVNPTVSAAGNPALAAPVTVPAGAGVIVNPTQASPLPAMGAQAYEAVNTGASAIAGAAMGMVQPADTTPVGGLVDYTLRITNATSGRVFVEAQDAAGEIYPCGFMTGSQSISSEKKQVAPIKGPITVVVRDPDKPDAPELRRYKVDPPTGYAGKTVEITIISGGLYQVSVDGQVRYITPTPVGKPDLGNAASTPAAVTAAAEAAKAAAAAPAAEAPIPAPAAPAPEQTPAGI